MPLNVCDGRVSQLLPLAPKSLLPLLLAHCVPQCQLASIVCCANQVVSVTTLLTGVDLLPGSVAAAYLKVLADAAICALIIHLYVNCECSKVCVAAQKRPAVAQSGPTHQS